MKEKMTRRAFLGLAAGTAGGLVLKASTSKEILIGIESAFARKLPEGQPDPYCERLILREQTISNTWQRYFGNKTDLMPYEAWSYRTPDQSDMGVVHRIAHLAQLHYTPEVEAKISFDEFFTKFLDDLHTLSKKADLDFVVLVNTLKVSGENIASDSQKSDLRHSQIQQGLMPSLRAFDALGLEDKFFDTAAPGGWATEKINGFVGKDCRDKLSIPEHESEYYNTIRMRNVESTTGIMDFEPGSRAEAYVKTPRVIKQEFARLYPHLVSRYEQAITERSSQEKLRKELQQAAEGYLKLQPKAMLPFALGDRDALAKIGISTPLDNWQLKNYTSAWLQAIRSLDKVTPETTTRTIEDIKQTAKTDLQKFLTGFISEQILNPKFLPYLIDQAIKNGGSREELIALQKLQNQKDSYENKLKDVQISISKILLAEGAMETDVTFQQYTTIMVTKMLSSKAGEFDPNNRDSLFWHIYKLICIREITPSRLLVNGSVFAIDSRTDPPYAPEAMLAKLEEFVDILTKKSVISAYPNQGIKRFIDVVNALRHGGKSDFPNLNYHQWIELKNYFEDNLVGIVYVNKLGKEYISNSPQIKELILYLQQIKLLLKSPEDDIIAFYKLILNLHTRKFDFYPNFSAAELEHVKSVIHTKAPRLSEALTNEIGFGEYPPLVRAQGVVGRLVA